MKSPWLLPLVLVVGVLCTRTSLELFRGLHGARRWREGVLLLVLGWIPSLAWTASQFILQD
jgi:hypothetical protein